MSKRLYLSDQDVESLRRDYEKHHDFASDEVDHETQLDSDGYIVGVQFNRCDGSGNIVTGYQETFGSYGTGFGAVDMQDGEGGSEYVTKPEEIPQLSK